MSISLNVTLVDNITRGMLIARGQMREAGRSIYVSSCGIEDSDGNSLAAGAVVGRYERVSHLPKGIAAEHRTADL